MPLPLQCNKTNADGKFVDDYAVIVGGVSLTNGSEPPFVAAFASDALPGGTFIAPVLQLMQCTSV